MSYPNDPQQPQTSYPSTGSQDGADHRPEFGKQPAPGAPFAGNQPPGGYPSGPYGRLSGPARVQDGPNRGSGSCTPALILVAVGFLLVAIGQFLYFPTRDFSLAMQRAGAVVSGAGWLVIAVGAVVAAATKKRF